MNLDDMDRRGGAWLNAHEGATEVVISSRIRLARNLVGYPFLSRASDNDRREICDILTDRLSGIGFGPREYVVDLEELDRLDARFLVERHLISRELESAKGPRAVVFGSDETDSAMVNEEDHLRIQVMRPGNDLKDAWENAVGLDTELECDVTFAATERHGYLTACPTNAGTGLRASVMLHLPALVHMKQIEKVFHACQRTGLTVRGFYGEGTMASGDFYQVSNQVTLGRREEEILEGLETLLPRLVEYEEACRKQLASRGKVRLEDKVHRSLATLRAARMLSSEEAMQHLSGVRLGVVMKILREVDLQRVNDLFVLTQPAHLQKLEGRELEPEERDVRRAAFVRESLH